MRILDLKSAQDNLRRAKARQAELRKVPRHSRKTVNTKSKTKNRRAFKKTQGRKEDSLHKLMIYRMLLNDTDSIDGYHSPNQIKPTITPITPITPEIASSATRSATSATQHQQPPLGATNTTLRIQIPPKGFSTPTSSSLQSSLSMNSRNSNLTAFNYYPSSPFDSPDPIPDYTGINPATIPLPLSPSGSTVWGDQSTKYNYSKKSS